MLFSYGQTFRTVCLLFLAAHHLGQAFTPRKSSSFQTTAPCFVGESRNPAAAAAATATVVGRQSPLPRQADITTRIATTRLHMTTSTSTSTTATAATTTAGPAVLDRPQVVEERVVQKKKQGAATPQRDHQGHEAWEVRIYNDGLNTREHVARSLVQITGMAEILAYQTMMTAHQNGMAVVGRYMYEIAEAYYEALRRDGIICDLVPVEGD